ncbi:hypothetical protein HOY80DRAFT_75003 [Tuber brumale]|nr:hypothetical protein HOY80DRAFT_75003 [Tuber brumale]
MLELFQLFPAKGLLGLWALRAITPPDVDGTRHYGRLKRFQGCGRSFLCNTECQTKSWYKHSPHPAATKEHYDWDPDRKRPRGTLIIQ